MGGGSGVVFKSVEEDMANKHLLDALHDLRRPMTEVAAVHRKSKTSELILVNSVLMFRRRLKAGLGLDRAYGDSLHWGMQWADHFHFWLPNIHGALRERLDAERIAAEKAEYPWSPKPLQPSSQAPSVNDRSPNVTAEEVSIKEAAGILELSRSQVSRLARAGTLTIVKDTKPKRVSTASVLKYRSRESV
jgi:hypothetical protein